MIHKRPALPGVFGYERNRRVYWVSCQALAIMASTNMAA